MIDQWYHGIVTNPEGRKIAYTMTPGSIVELFRTFDLVTVLPEMNSIHCGVKHVADGMIHQAEALGYPTDICGYMKSDLGPMTETYGGVGPFGKIPKPDLLVLNSAGCFTSIKWFEALSRRFQCPLQMVDIPFMSGDELPDYSKAYIKGQLEELIGVCEKISRTKFDIDKLRSILELSREAIGLSKKLLDFAMGSDRPSAVRRLFRGCFVHGAAHDSSRHAGMRGILSSSGREGGRGAG